MKAIILCAAFLAAAPASAGVLYNFGNQNDAAVPRSGLLSYNGVQYGTTYAGGDKDFGTIFALAPDGTETVLHYFDGAHGSHPMYGSLVADKQGNLYGTTSEGGLGEKGTVFRLAPDGAFKVLHNFRGLGANDDGGMPYGGVVLDREGNLYGAAYYGGEGNCGLFGCGIIYSITRDGSYRILHHFDGTDGLFTQNLTIDRQGNLYGTAFSKVFKLAPDGTYTVLHTFDHQLGAGVTVDKAGNLYGGTLNNVNDLGGVFKITPDGTTTILHNFDMSTGYYMVGAPVIGTDGSVYGAAMKGAKTNYPHCGDMSGCGTVFRITPDGTYTVLRYFAGRNGYAPTGNLTADRKGNLYGTASFGGTYLRGTAFKIKTTAQH